MVFKTDLQDKRDEMNKIVGIVKSEPALIMGLIGSAVALVVTFGFKMSVDQVGGIMTFVSALVAVIIRQQVVPVASLPSTTDPVTSQNPPLSNQ